MPTTVKTAMLVASALLYGCGGGGDGGDGGGSSETPPPPPAQAAGGLDVRPTNTTCLAGVGSRDSGTIRLERAFEARTFNAPIGLVQAPADNSRWFVIEQAGRVRDFEVSSSSAAGTFIDISARVASPATNDGSETGLLGMAFHPQYPTATRVFLSYTHRTAGNALVSRISEFAAVDTGNGRRELDPLSEQVLLTVMQPFNNHNGGHIGFGPDGLLYIGFGDGGSGGDPQNNAQRLTTLLGKLLRIDIDAGAPYSIPATNPNANGAICGNGGNSSSGNCAEIYAYGLRNPWRWSFDRATDDLWLADVGQNQWEEVNVIERGGNYGWRCREGAHDFNTSGCATSGLIEPIAEYAHTEGNVSITGGYVYRGSQSSSLQGRYLFADFASGRIWTAEPNTRVPRELLDTSLNIASFAEGNDGELYVVDLKGSLHHIVFEAGAQGDTGPTLLSETGCVDAANPSQPASGLIPYSVNAPFWSDGAEKERWLALPNGTQLNVSAAGDWATPAGSVLMKHFRLEGRLIETRLLMHHTDGEWSGATFEWDAEQSNATRIRGGARRTLGSGQAWLFPSESDCLVCHTAAAGRSLGLQTAQLNRDHRYVQTNRTSNQVRTFDALAMLNPAPGEPANLATMPDPYDANAAIDQRARAWLHTNCSQCHRPNGPTNSNMDLRYQIVLGATNTCNVAPANDLALPNMLLIAPGSSTTSMVVNRANRRDAQQMPPLGSLQVDSAGIALLSQWIDGMGGC